MILKFKSGENVWIMLQGKTISYAHFLIQPSETERFTLITESTEEIPKDAVVEFTDDIETIDDLLKMKLIDACGSDFANANIHYHYGQLDNAINFFIAVLIDDKDVYILDGAEKAYILNDDGKTIEKL